MDGTSKKPLCLDGSAEDFAFSIVQIHDDIVCEKGLVGVVTEETRNEAAERVLSAVSASFCTFFGLTPAERFADLFEQVAEFAEHLAKDHIFLDGNKRTTVKVSLALLTMAGFAFDVEDIDDQEHNEVYLWIQSIVVGNKTKAQLAEELRLHSVKLDSID